MIRMPDPSRVAMMGNTLHRYLRVWPRKAVGLREELPPQVLWLRKLPTPPVLSGLRSYGSWAGLSRIETDETRKRV
jgi:hypothetical protein